MKIAITATAPDLDAKMDPRFGRCPFFLIVETDNLSFEAIENPNLTLGGAGIQSAQLMADKGVQHVLTGNCGPNAHQTLAAANIAISVGCSGPIREAIEQLKTDGLTATLGPNVAGHFGTGSAFTPNRPDDADAGFAPGIGQGTGRGMGGGMGRGRGLGQGGGGGMRMGRGGGRGRGMALGGGSVAGAMGASFPQGAAPMSQAASASLNTSNELTMLRRQAEDMAQQTQQIHERIRQLEQEGKAGAVVVGTSSVYQVTLLELEDELAGKRQTLDAFGRGTA